MRPPVQFLVAVSIACLALLWFLFRTHATTAELETRLADAKHTRDRLGTALQQTEETLRPTATSSQSQQVDVPTPPSGSQPAAPAQAQRPPSFADLLRDNPQLAGQWVATRRAELQRRYGVMFQTLNLTLGQREKFKDIVAAKVARDTDLGAAAMAQGLDFDDPVIRKLADESRKQLDTELRAELGEKNFQAYQEFDRSIPLRGFVDGFAVQVAMTDPLTPAQATQLAEVLVAATPAAEPGHSLDPARVDWPIVDRRAAQFLSPTQLAAWKLGVAHNPAGGSRLDHELKRAYDAAVAKSAQRSGP